MEASWNAALNDVSWMIELLIDCHPQGFDVLLGEVPPPLPAEVHAMMDALRSGEVCDWQPVSPSRVAEAERIVWDSEDFDRAVSTARGWPHITLVSQEYKEADPRLWAVVMDHARFVGTATTRHISRLGYVAARYGLAPNTVMKYRREFPITLGKAILVYPSDSDSFQLLPG